MMVWTGLRRPGSAGRRFLMAIVIGALAGWLAEKFTAANMGVIANIVMGFSAVCSATISPTSCTFPLSILGAT